MCPRSFLLHTRDMQRISRTVHGCMNSRPYGSEDFLRFSHHTRNMDVLPT
jgi:hypothetical protein